MNINRTIVIVSWITILIAIMCIVHYIKTLYDKVPITVGEKYLYKIEWINNNPFYYFKTDTIIILDIKNGYVKYKAIGDPDEFFHTDKVYYLKDYIKELKSE